MMTLAVWPFALGTVCILGIIWWWTERHRRGIERIARESLAQKVLHQQGEIAQIGQDLVTETRRRVEVVEVIAQIERERNQWKEKYWEAALGHSAAQEMLLREIERLSKLAVSHKIPHAEIQPACKRVVSEYRGRHDAAIQGALAASRIETGVAVAEQAPNKVDSPST